MPMPTWSPLFRPRPTPEPRSIDSHVERKLFRASNAKSDIRVTILLHGRIIPPGQARTAASASCRFGILSWCVTFLSNDHEIFTIHMNLHDSLLNCFGWDGNLRRFDVAIRCGVCLFPLVRSAPMRFRLRLEGLEARDNPSGPEYLPPGDPGTGGGGGDPGAGDGDPGQTAPPPSETGIPDPTDATFGDPSEGYNP